MAGEVLGVVEGAGGALAAAQPERGGVAADGAEASAVLSGDVKRAKAAHRDSPDRDSVGVGVQPRDRLRDHLANDVGAPCAVGSVMPIGISATVWEDDVRGTRPEPRERCEHRVVEARVLVASLAVQEDQ